jgi:hypothetical protein
MAMTLRAVLSRTPKSRRFSSQWVKFKEIKLGKHKATNAPVIRAKSYSTHNKDGVRKNYTPNEYVSTVEIYGRHVVLSCSCDDFWSTFEWALAQQGAARIEYSNGERPVIRNPSALPGACKHLYKLGERMVEKGKL